MISRPLPFSAMNSQRLPPLQGGQADPGELEAVQQGFGLVEVVMAHLAQLLRFREPSKVLA